MPIKSDKWIRRMCEEHGMIEPFEPNQVREGVISYGLSSYGYDIRVAPEFKVFTNVHNVVVDPKAFDPRSFIDVRERTCIVPPNSFALARTEEYFRMPRNVLAICVGKSTYARCFSGDTRVALLDGTSVALEDMARRGDDGELFWGYGLGPYGRIEAVLLDVPRFIGRDQLLEIHLDNGEVIRCTPDHEFILRDGTIQIADDLREGTSLMPLYRNVVRGYESIYQPLNGHLCPTHRLADEWNVRNGVYDARPSTHRHHRDHDRRNNNPWNIERIAAADHIRLHNEISYGDEFDSEEHGSAIKQALASRAEDPAWRPHFSEVQRDRALKFWHDEVYVAARERLRAKHLANWSTERRDEVASRMRARYEDPAARRAQGERQRLAWQHASGERRARQAEIARAIRLRPEITREAVVRALHETGSVRGAARLLACDRSVFKRFPGLVDEFRGRPRRNHKVTAVDRMAGDHDVFCLTVPEAGNFALNAGVFVRNCGIVVNVTPLEPGWEGYLTLEISNTTPLPAKIYAGEGIAQLLFLEGDEEPSVAYADRKGKYQHQTGVTLPRL
jgi:dCTP deaminase